MSNITDPSPQLQRILNLCSAGRLPKKVRPWAEGSLSTTEGILATIEDMVGNGVDAPTEGQTRALLNIYHAACAHRDEVFP